MKPDTNHAHTELEERLRFETLIADLSSSFINLPPGHVDRAIMDAQRRICEMLGLDLAGLWQWSNGLSGPLCLTHLYGAVAAPLPEPMAAADYFPWYQEQMLEGRVIAFSTLDELPPAAARDRDCYRTFGIKSNLTVPLSVGGGPPVGALGFNTTRSERNWPEALVMRLRLIAQIFANALARKHADQALQESEALNRATFEQAAVGIAHVSTDGKWLRVNDRLCAMLGFSREELLAMTFQDVTHPDDLDEDLQWVRRVAAGEISTYSMEKRYFRKGGGLLWANLSVSLVRVTAGQPAHFISVLEDITGRKNSEEAFRASEARLAAGADVAGLGYYEVDYAERTCFIDARFREICGVPPGLEKGLEVVAFWLDHVHPEDRRRLLDERDMLHRGAIDRISAEYRYSHPTDGPKWIHHLARIARTSASQGGARTYGVIRDISATKRLSEQLQTAAEEWQATFNAIQDFIMVLDRQHRIRRVNAAALSFLGLPEEQVIGQPCYRLMHGLECPIPGCPGQITLSTGRSAALELLHERSGRWLRLSTDPIRDAGGKVVGAVHVGRDLTAARQAQAELLRQRTELAHIGRVSTMGELAASVAHELNQPLGAILANAEAAELFLQRDPPDLLELGDILTAIRKDDERAAEVIRRMRSLLRKREFERKPIELNALVEEVWPLVSGDAGLRGVSLLTDLAPLLPKISGDRVHLQQVLLNLIINGMDAMEGLPRDQRRLWVRTRLRENDQVELVVSDCGPGIDPDRQQRLFEPFYTTKANGMGMGLSITRTIVETHRGRIWAENNTPCGAAFHVVLPVITENSETAHA